MFRKGKKKSRQEDVKVDTTNNNFVAEEASTSDSQRIPDRTDGNFDSNGFVDLSPPEDKRPTLLGPKQPCQVTLLGHMPLFVRIEYKSFY